MHCFEVEGEKINSARGATGRRSGAREDRVLLAPRLEQADRAPAASAPPRSGSLRFLNRLALLGCLILLTWLVSAGAAFAALVNQPMTGATAPGWVIGGSAYLTASTGTDPAGSGWLRITEPDNDQAGYGFFDSPFDISQGAVIQFDYATWGGSGADGYSIYLFDGSYDWSSFSVGASGGSLGYAQKVGTGATDDPGLTGGYIGVGIDEYGNFSSPTEGRIGGTGLVNNSVAVRGPYNHPSGAFYYLGGSASLAQQLDFPNQLYRPSQSTTQYRKVVIYLTPQTAPNYLRVDVYLQYGANQPLTQVVNGLMVGRPVPATVKVGYGASTGGATNYHEIRNLVIDPLPTDINLALSKTVSSATVAQGGTLTYTVTARNYGPRPTTASNVPITDSVPAQLTSVTWNCAGSNGGTCGAASGSGNNLSTSATLPFNSAVTYTISGTVNPVTPLGTVLSNTAALSAPAGITDYNPADDSATATSTVSGAAVTLSGNVYNDSGAGGGTAHNGVRDGSEAGVNAGLTYYAKLFRSSDLTTTVVAPVQVNSTTGAYSFTGVPAWGNYTVILSSTNTANAFDPSLPSANWTYVAPLNLTLDNVVASGANLTGQDFFLYNGSRIAGKVIKDDGFNGSISTAYDGILNAAETGIPGVTVTLRNDGNTTTYDSTATDSGGNFTLFTNVASATVRIYQTNLAGYSSVSYNAGNTGGSYTMAGEYLRFAYTRYTDYSAILFGDIPNVSATFIPTPQGSSGTEAAPVYFPHTFTATGHGSVGFAANSRTQGGWPAVSYVLDSNQNGSFDAGEPDITSAVNVSAGVPLHILVRVTIPSGTAPGTSDQLVTRASFSYGPLSLTQDATDITTVANYPSLATSTKNWTDLDGAGQLPGDVLQYSINIKESNGVAVANASLSDSIDTANLTGLAVVSCPAGATCGFSAGLLSVTGLNLAAGGSASVVYNVSIAATAVAGTTIDNTATLTLPGYPGVSAVAPTVTVSGPLPPGAAVKQLYFAAPVAGLAQTMSRLPQSSGATSVTLPRGNSTAYDYTWSTAAATTKAITLGGGGNSVILQMRAERSPLTLDVTLSYAANSAGPWTTIGTYNASTNITTGGTPQSYSLPLTMTGTSIPAGSFIRLTIRNSGSASTTRDLFVYPYNASGTLGSTARVELNSQTVINVDSLAVYSAPFSGGSPVATAQSGSTVYIRAQVSDPFGYDDISGATLTLKDPGNNPVAPSGSAVYTPATTPAAPAGTKVFEYSYAIPASGPAGNWSVRVTAQEGTEGTVSHSANSTMPVALPQPLLSILKSANPGSANPGQVITYTVQIANTGTGAGTSVVIRDDLSPYAFFNLSYGTGGFNLTDSSPASGLTLGTPQFSEDNGASWSYPPSSGGGGAPAGYDGRVTNWRIPMTGTIRAGGSIGLNYRVMVK